MKPNSKISTHLRVTAGHSHEAGAFRRERLWSASLVLLLFLLASPLSAFDYGLIVSSESQSDIGPEVIVLDQSFAAQLWSDIAIGETGGISAQGSVRYALGSTPFVNLDELVLDLSLASTGRSTTRLSAGRFLWTDPTGLVLSDSADGVSLTTTLPAAETSMAIGYTGLMLDRVSTVIVSRADLFDRSDDSPFAPPRLMAQATASFLELFGRQSLTVGLLGQLDLRQDDEATAIHTAYGSAALSGPVGAGAYYDGFAVINVGGYDETTILAALYGASFETYFPVAVRPTLSVSGFVATGDEDSEALLEGNTAGLSRGFEPISTGSLGFLVAPRIQNLVAGRISGSIVPFATAQSAALRRTSVLLSALVLGRPTTGWPSLRDVTTDSVTKYYGTEASLRVEARLLSDLGIIIESGMFIPSPAAFADSALRFRIAFGATLSL